MDAQYNDVPCSSIAVESIISVGTGGLIWGSCAGNYDAKLKGLTGIDRASFVNQTCHTLCSYTCSSKTINSFIFYLPCRLRRLANMGFNVVINDMALIFQFKITFINFDRVHQLKSLFCDIHFLLLSCLGLFAGIFSFTRCGIRRYRKKNDWVNALVAGGVAGAAIGAGTRNWKQVAVMAAFLSGVCAIADQSQAI
ncbi:hypothetical protein CTI12_AA607400 [Artemisia annua]|uniref:Mitochondrial inner membrane translocase subunit Tim17/Tim22/Tim23/peroxisomal protein PMP24 n=1 Tax=Artemisia annua TaxID=35608 RepID=A0A2U1KFV6_ARTAN|nr:hypothetical protein CTI12_AA607400 [Artemisia annua]